MSVKSMSEINTWVGTKLRKRDNSSYYKMVTPLSKLLKEERKSNQRVRDPPKNSEPMQKRHEGSQIQGVKLLLFKVEIKQKSKKMLL